MRMPKPFAIGLITGYLYDKERGRTSLAISNRRDLNDFYYNSLIDIFNFILFVQMKIKHKWHLCCVTTNFRIGYILGRNLTKRNFKHLENVFLPY